MRASICIAACARRRRRRCGSTSWSAKDGRSAVHWDSVEGLFREGVLDAMFERFTALLTALAADASLWHAGALDTVPPATKALLAQVNGTAADVAGAQVHLQAPVLARMAQTPTALAVVSAARSLTYAELDRASARLATALAGVPPNELVAVVMPKHWAQVVAVLGILRAGAAYLPIDADLPPARVAQLLALGEVRRIVSLADGGRTGWRSTPSASMRPGWRRTPRRSPPRPRRAPTWRT